MASVQFAFDPDVQTPQEIKDGVETLQEHALRYGLLVTGLYAGGSLVDFMVKNTSITWLTSFVQEAKDAGFQPYIVSVDFDTQLEYVKMNADVYGGMDAYHRVTGDVVYIPAPSKL